MIVNKFSKQEAAGHGLRSELAGAIMAGGPVLTAVPEKCFDAWKEFTGDRGTSLLCARHVVDAWWQDAAQGRRAFRAAGCRTGGSAGYFPIITSDDLITAETLSPTLSSSSSTASFVIEDVTVSPEASSSLTWAVVDPLVTATTLPGRMLRALSFILDSCLGWQFRNVHAAERHGMFQVNRRRRVWPGQAQP